MTTANAVTGTKGQTLMRGIDIHSPSLQAEVNYSDHYDKHKNKSQWKRVTVAQLINSKVNSLNKIGRLLETSKGSLFRICSYMRTGNTYYLNVGKDVFRLYGNKVSLVKRKKK